MRTAYLNTLYELAEKDKNVFGSHVFFFLKNMYACPF